MLQEADVVYVESTSNKTANEFNRECCKIQPEELTMPDGDDWSETKSDLELWR